MANWNKNKVNTPELHYHSTYWEKYKDNRKIELHKLNLIILPLNILYLLNISGHAHARTHKHTISTRK